jgi:hypothetical protein
MEPTYLSISKCDKDENDLGRAADIGGRKLSKDSSKGQSYNKTEGKINTFSKEKNYYPWNICCFHVRGKLFRQGI